MRFTPRTDSPAPPVWPVWTRMRGSERTLEWYVISVSRSPIAAPTICRSVRIVAAAIVRRCRTGVVSLFLPMEP